jgi:hypothetical protein
MRIVFQKRRYYQGAFRNIGDVVEVSDRFARAFIRVGAAAPAPGKPESSVKPEEPKFIRRNLKVDPAIPEQPALVTEPEETEDSLEELPESEAVVEESKTEIPLDSLPYAQLRQLCKELDLPVNGKKEELLRRLSERGR